MIIGTICAVILAIMAVIIMFKYLQGDFAKPEPKSERRKTGGCLNCGAPIDVIATAHNGWLCDDCE